VGTYRLLLLLVASTKALAHAVPIAIVTLSLATLHVVATLFVLLVPGAINCLILSNTPHARLKFAIGAVQTTIAVATLRYTMLKTSVAT